VSDNRPFGYAVAASLGLHALLLFALPDLVDTARRAASIPPQIIARLMEPEPAPTPVPVPPVEQAAPQPPVEKKAAKPRPAPKMSVERPAPRAEPPAPPAPAPVAPAPLPAPPVAAVEPRPVPAPPAQATAPQPQPGPSPAPEALSRDQYRVQLIDEARRHKRYPPLARENNWQGDVRVGVAVGANGRPTVTLKGSSGYEVLDRQALEMFTQAARAVPVPPELRGREFALELRAVYGLED
jgi:periplasmic protein TonB